MGRKCCDGWRSRDRVVPSVPRTRESLMRCSLAHGHASSLWPSSLWQGVGGSKDGTGAWWAARRRTEPFGRLSLKNCEMCVYGTCVVTRLVKSCAYGLVSTVVPDPVECRTSTYPYARRRETSSQSHQPSCVDLTRLQREGRSRNCCRTRRAKSRQFGTKEV